MISMDTNMIKKAGLMMKAKKMMGEKKPMVSKKDTGKHMMPNGMMKDSEMKKMIPK